MTNRGDFVTDEFSDYHLSFAANAVRQHPIELYEYRLPVVDFAIHRFFAILENGDKLLRSLCAVDVCFERRFLPRTGLAYLNGFLTSHNEVAPFRLDTDKNSLIHFTTSGGSSSGAHSFTWP